MNGEEMMSRFEVAIRGRGLWISLDDEVQRVEFHVARHVDAVDAEEAARKALELVGEDPKARPEPGYPLPTLSVDDIEPSSAALHPQPGFAFYPDPE
jgi:hypothetical protein